MGELDRNKYRCTYIRTHDAHDSRKEDAANNGRIHHDRQPDAHADQLQDNYLGGQKSPIQNHKCKLYHS